VSRVGIKTVTKVSEENRLRHKVSLSRCAPHLRSARKRGIASVASPFCRSQENQRSVEDAMGDDQGSETEASRPHHRCLELVDVGASLARTTV